MTAASMMQQQIRLGFRITGDTFSSGSVNTGVILFPNAPVDSFPASRYPLAQWCTVTNSATLGTSFKFLRKGIYDVHAVFPVPDGAADLIVRLQLSQDSQFLTPSINTVNPIAAFLSYDAYSPTAAGIEGALKVGSSVSIRNSERSSATYATLSPVGTSPVGTVRLHGSVGAGATPIDGRGFPASQLWCNQLAELFG